MKLPYKLMSGAGWAEIDGDYGSSEDIYLTYSFYKSGSSYSYLSAFFNSTTSNLTAMTSVGQASVKSALNEIEKFTNLNFIEVDDNSSNYGDIRFTMADASVMQNSLGFAFYPSVRRLTGNSYSDAEGDVFLK